MLVVAEHELIEIEKLFSKALNIPILDDDQPPKKQVGYAEDMLKDMESKKISSDRFKDRLMQWRLLFFIDVIRETTLKELSLDTKHDKLYLHIKLLDFLTTTEIYDKSKNKAPLSQKKSINTENAKTPRSGVAYRGKL